MEHALEFALENECDTMFLGVWEENHRAVAFYKKYGFEVFATRTFKLGSNLCDDFLMRLSL
jgi:ribosomal protein S18 acetylase RimI-like enzyme